jgi:C1A family cysteine protease
MAPRPPRTSMRGLGWVSDSPDPRDHTYVAPPAVLERLPRRKDLRDGCPPVYDQLGLNSCSANAVAASVEFDLMKERKKRVIFPSRLFLYYNTRQIEGTVRSNVGVSIRDAIKSVARQGDCPESLWRYVERKFRTKPPQKCYNNALRYRAVEYQRIHRSLDHFRSCLASGSPFVFGFLAHKNFHDVVRKTGRLEMPMPGERVLGQHAVVAVGYEDKERRFIVRNSWGRWFGLKGYFTMPYEYLLKEDLTNDFWTIRVVG